jgi:hypothetical protein
MHRAFDDSNYDDFPTFGWTSKYETPPHILCYTSTTVNIGSTQDITFMLQVTNILEN